MLTVRARPSRSLPWNVSMALLASSLEDISTNANPRDLPVNLSWITLVEVTLPACENRSDREFSVVSNDKLPTYTLLLIKLTFLRKKKSSAIVPVIGFQKVTEDY